MYDAWIYFAWFRTDQREYSLIPIHWNIVILLGSYITQPTKDQYSDIESRKQYCSGDDNNDDNDSNEDNDRNDDNKNA